MRAHLFLLAPTLLLTRAPSRYGRLRRNKESNLSFWYPTLGRRHAGPLVASTLREALRAAAMSSAVERYFH
jgi:hypothetical protein